MDPQPKTFSISHGPQFDGLLSTVGLFLSFAGGGFTAYAIYIADAPSVGAGLLVAIFFFGLFLDIRGVEFDFQRKRLRQYRSLFGYKSGRWEPFSDFDRIGLYWDRSYAHSATSILTASGRTSASDSYYVVLKGPEGVLPFEVGEYATHKGARKRMLMLSEKLGLPATDEYQKRLDLARKRRLEVEARRHRARR